VLAAGGEVWFGDETTLREFPPLRAGWAKRGQQQEVVVSGRNARRVLHGAINVGSGEVVRLVRERCRADDAIAFLQTLGAVRPQVPKLLVWDNAPPHHPHRVRDAATAAQIQLAFLPFRAPELMPCEDLWRLLKVDVAANRVYELIQELVEHALAWLDRVAPAEVLRKCGLLGSKFNWLPT
jgi:transposase